MKIGFALEYSLGHITHGENLKQFLSGYNDVSPVTIQIPYDGAPMPPLLKPLLKDNWSVRASLAARKGLTPYAGDLSACFFHTQVTSLFSGALMRRVPSVISLDATPLQYDDLGAFYKHNPGPAPLERIKRRMNERAYQGARHLVTWSQWTKNSLVQDYGIAESKITVIPPGIDVAAWRRPSNRAVSDETRFLFVGGDFERKGGATLLEAFRIVHESAPKTRLVIVTKTLVEDFAMDGVEVHRGMTPNSDALKALYASADVFVFPTMGDCLPLAVMEALAAGLPVITSNVGALGEAVTHGEQGMVVPTSDPAALADAMCALASDPELRARMSAAAEARADDRFNASKNYRRLIDILKRIA